MDIKTVECGNCNIEFVPYHEDYLCPACRGEEPGPTPGINRVLVHHYDSKVTGDERLIDIAFIDNTVFIDLVEKDEAYRRTELVVKATVGVHVDDLLSALKALGVIE